jgi:hypothetical protein
VEENAPGDVNIENNWGNSIVIKHGEHLYSQLSHLYINSFKVSLGDYVRKGDVIALLGNSGRSPYPHIHFQLQSTPYVGSPTISWPISYYLKENQEGHLKLHSFQIPEEGELLSNIERAPLLQEAYSFIPGQVISWKEVQGDKSFEIKWIVGVNAYNQTYIYCEHSGSYAYLLNNGNMFYFLSFDGDRSSLLFHFYMANYQVLLGYYPDVIIKDQLPLSILPFGVIRIAQDFIAPFKRLLKISYELEYSGIDSDFNAKQMLLRSRVSNSVWGISRNRNNYEIELLNGRIDRFEIKSGGKKITAYRKDELN